MEECKHLWHTDCCDFCHCMMCGLDHDDYNLEEWEKHKRNLARRIKAVRQALKLSQKKFAAYIGMVDADGARAIRYYESAEKEPPIWFTNKLIELEKLNPNNK